MKKLKDYNDKLV